MKRWTLWFLIFILLSAISNCAPQEKVIYKDVPADQMVIKRATLDQLLKDLISTKMELRECLERERK